ncbi:MAG: hypothetical protein F4Y03_11190 [Alphaproteobacteria bacterium]|nr:hypothetical protein [Alphaproteobacteria bacterium]
MSSRHFLLPAGIWTRVLFWVVWVSVAGAFVGAAWAEARAPRDLAGLLESKPGSELSLELGEEMRREAMRAAALSYGAQGGLAWRSWKIEHDVIAKHADNLDRLYGFRRLTETRHGFTVVPPVVGETRQAVRLGRGGRRAASAARVVRIMEPERLATAPPHWRDFLVRSWKEPEPPVSLLFPRDKAEEVDWARWIAEGWQEGVRQADAIFAADLDRLNAVLEGIARWGTLHDARMVGAPVVQVSEAATAGDGRVMRVGEKLVRLGRPAELEVRARKWRGFVFRSGRDEALSRLPAWSEAGP